MKKLFLFLVAGLFLLSGCVDSAQKTTEASCIDSKSSMRVVLNIQRKIKPEHIAAYKEAFEACRALTLKEEGCIDYTLYQSYTDSTMFALEETWVNEGALAKHGESEHLKVLREATKDMPDPDFKSKVARIYVCPYVNTVD